jgi:hypothetical protein
VSPNVIGIYDAQNGLRSNYYINGKDCSGGLEWEQCIASVSVYTTDETANIQRSLQEQINSVNSAVKLVDQQVTVAERRLQLQIQTGLNALPQRLLSNEAKKAIQDAITTEVKEKLDEMRKEFQAQIDQMKDNRVVPE